MKKMQAKKSRLRSCKRGCRITCGGDSCGDGLQCGGLGAGSLAWTGGDGNKCRGSGRCSGGVTGCSNGLSFGCGAGVGGGVLAFAGHMKVGGGDGELCYLL
jgi:hypothetical protein